MYEFWFSSALFGRISLQCARMRVLVHGDAIACTIRYNSMRSSHICVCYERRHLLHCVHRTTSYVFFIIRFVPFTSNSPSLLIWKLYATKHAAATATAEKKIINETKLVFKSNKIINTSSYMTFRSKTQTICAFILCTSCGFVCPIHIVHRHTYLMPLVVRPATVCMHSYYKFERMNERTNVHFVLECSKLFFFNIFVR